MAAQKKRMETRQLTACALFAAMIAVGAWISIPVGEIAVTMQLLAIMLCASLMKPFYAMLSVIAYILLGAVGLPVFSGFRAGLGVVLGVTGGYMVGFIPAAYGTSWIIERWGRAWWKQVLAMVMGNLLCYTLGTVWFMHLSGRGVMSSLSICVIPFLPFECVKMGLATALSCRLYGPMKRLLG